MFDIEARKAHPAAVHIFLEKIISDVIVLYRRVKNEVFTIFHFSSLRREGKFGTFRSPRTMMRFQLFLAFNMCVLKGAAFILLEFYELQIDWSEVIRVVLCLFEGAAAAIYIR